MENAVSFISDGLELSGVLHVPERARPDRQNPAFVVSHGFGSHKDAPNCIIPAKLLCDLGYVVLRFDMRGCGASAGKKGRVICLEQVADTSNAVSWLSEHALVDARRIALLGNSVGAAVSIYTGGVDPRVAAVVASSGWGDGEKKFRAQHSSPEAWSKFSSMMAEGRRLVQAGESMLVPRYDIVPIPVHMRKGIDSSKESIKEFPVETVLSMHDFVPDSMVGKIAPRPLLLMHAAQDSVTPTQGSIELFRRSGQPTELHLFSDVDHFLLAEENERVHHVLRDWLQRFFPVERP